MLQDKNKLVRSIWRRLYIMRTFLTKRLAYIAFSTFILSLGIHTILEILTTQGTISAQFSNTLATYIFMLVFVSTFIKVRRYTKFVKEANAQSSIETTRGAKVHLGVRSRYLLGAPKEARKAWDSMQWFSGSEPENARILWEVLKNNRQAKKGDFIQAAYESRQTNTIYSIEKNVTIRTAYHEAGHAVIGAYLGLPITYVDIRPTYFTHGVTQYSTASTTQSYYQMLWKSMVLSYAGSLAELILNDDVNLVRGHAGDIAHIQENANLIWHAGVRIDGVFYQTPFDLMDQARTHAQILVSKHAEDIRRVSSELLVKKQLAVSEIIDLLPDLPTDKVE
jgi:hypothetical protein